MELTPQQIELFDFVKEKHKNQVRKYTNEPYWTHLYNVAEILKYHACDHLIEIGLCHDLLEDTDCRSQELSEKLRDLKYKGAQNRFICAGVISLTNVFTSKDYPNLNRKERKKLERDRLIYIDGHYQTVKYADILDNCSTIRMYDLNFSKVYLKEKKELLGVLFKGNKYLHEQAFKIVENG